MARIPGGKVNHHGAMTRNVSTLRRSEKLVAYGFMLPAAILIAVLI